MKVTKKVSGGKGVAVVSCGEVVIKDSVTAGNFALSAKKLSSGCTLIAVNKEAFSPDFYILSTGIADNVNRKFAELGVKVAVYGDFTKGITPNLKAYINKCNEGGSICFAPDERRAVSKLGSGE